MSDSINSINSIDSINLFNLSLGDAGPGGICMICRESINLFQIYKLPECNHEFHTHCIVTWFRSGDSSCPCCRNKGINYTDKTLYSNYKYSWNRYGDNPVFKELKKISKNKDCPQILITEFNKLNQLTDKVNLAKKEYQDYQKYIKENSTVYAITRKQIQKLRHAKYSAERAVQRHKRVIQELPIIPLIIPTPVDINF